MNERCLKFRERLKELTSVKKANSKKLEIDQIEDYPEEYENGYNQYVNSQRSNFEEIINLINDIISVLKREGIISETSQISARIKAYSSAKENHLKGRNLKDVFGIELIGATEREKRYLSKMINGMINRKRGRQRQKDYMEDKRISRNTL